MHQGPIAEAKTRICCAGVSAMAAKCRAAYRDHSPLTSVVPDISNVKGILALTQAPSPIAISIDCGNMDVRAMFNSHASR